MKLNAPNRGVNRKGLVKGLLLCTTFTLLLSLAFGLWFSMTRGYSAVVTPENIAMIQLDAPQAGDPSRPRAP